MIDLRSLVGTAGVACALATMTEPATAQIIERLFPFLGPAPPAVASSVPDPKGPRVSDWSGQSGSSGHPLMTAEAILAAAANFKACLEGLWPDAARRGVSRETFDAYTRELTPDLRIMDLLDAQPEFTKAVWDYLDAWVKEDRTSRGKRIRPQTPPFSNWRRRTMGVNPNTVPPTWAAKQI